MVNERIAELENTIEDLREKILEAEREICDIRAKNSCYWILKTTYGDGDCWDEYYTPVGFMTTDAAKKWYEENYNKKVENTEDIEFLSSLHEARHYEDDVFYAVSKEEWHIYFRWQKLDKAIKSLELLCAADFNECIENPGKLLVDLKKHTEELVKQIGIEYLSFQHICT